MAKKTNKFLHICLTALLIIFLNVLPLFAGDATLSWDAPTTNTDGSPLTDLSGFNVYYGTSSGSYSQSTDVGNVTTYQVTNLTGGLTYYFAVTAYDTSGNESGYSSEVNKTIQSVDTTPPVISGVYTSNITTTEATINWTTDEDSDSQVEYGTTVSYGYTTVLNSTLETVHSEGLSGLSPSTQYHYRVLSKDASGNISTSSDYTFTTLDVADTIAPVISNVQASNIQSSSATITWTTDEAATSQVEYGLNTSYGFLTILDSNLVTTHSVDIAGLSSFTTYDFRVRSKDAADNEKLSSNYTFTTSNLPPSITSLTATPDSGFASLMVDFTATASDPDGFIAIYEWDFDGDGTYDEDTGTVSSTYYIYTNAGTYNTRVRVTDDGGTTVVSNIVTVTVNSPANQSPIISSFNATPNSGTTPLQVTFTTSVSDPDGSIVQYEWDFDGNGTYDSTTTTNPVSYTYCNNGTYTAKVRVTDDDGATATSSVTVVASLADSDGDGVSDDEESTYDGNGDGISDRLQSDVATFNTATGSGLITIYTGSGILSNVQSYDITELPSSPTLDEEDGQDCKVGKYFCEEKVLAFPHGLYGFHVIGLSPGESTQVTLIFPDTIPQDGFWYYYNSNTNTWSDFSANTEQLTDGDNVVLLNLTDGGAGDSDNLANGVIEDPSGLLTTSEGKGGCFIATAAYGSYLDQHVMVLREFRDKHLLTNLPGRILVSIYYKTSPPLAYFIARHEALRAATRLLLTPIVFGVKFPQLSFIVFVTIIGFVVYFVCYVKIYRWIVCSSHSNNPSNDRRMWNRWR